MHPFFHIGHFELPAYLVLSLLGIAVASLYVTRVNRRGRFGRLPGNDLVHIGILAVLGGVVGAKLLYLLTALPVLLRASSTLRSQPGALVNLLFGGMVFYGGLFGGLLAAWGYCRLRGLSFRTLAAIATPAIPLFHSFGRVGCFLAGCCWGIPWGDGGALFPVQLVEAGGNLLLFLLLWRVQGQLRQPENALPLYGLLYSSLRFILEFFRGDIHRGGFILSTSAWISILVFFVSLCVFQRQKKKNKVGNA